jgi:hypothetical protein
VRKAVGRVGFHHWRLYPDPKSRLYVRVYVFDRRCDQRAFFRMLSPSISKRMARQTRAVCVEAEVRDRRTKRRKPVVAAVLFDKSRLGAGLVAHEMLHALACWARRTKLDLTDLMQDGEGLIPADAPEERAAGLLGELVRQFTVKAIQAKLI